MLSLSMFENDGGLGESYRIVVLAGTATNNSYVNSNNFVRQQMINALTASGFGVPAVRLAGSGYQVNFEIEINARQDHSAEWVRQNVNTILSNATYIHAGPGGAAAGPQTSYLLRNVSLRVVSDDTRTQSASQSQWPTPRVNVNITNPGNPSGSSSGLGSSGFLDSLGTGLGISTPIVVLGGGLLLILMLRR